MSDSWEHLRAWFEHDDGSLPEIEISGLDSQQVHSALSALKSRGHDVTRGGASAATEDDGPHHVVLRLEHEGVTIPDLGVTASPGALCIDYRMGRQWGPETLEAFLGMLAEVLRHAPHAKVRHQRHGREFEEILEHLR